MKHVGQVRFGAGLLAPLACVCLLTALAPAAAWAATVEDKTQFSVTAGSLSFSTAPATPTLGPVTLNGAAQTTNATAGNVGAFLVQAKSCLRDRHSESLMRGAAMALEEEFGTG